MRGILFIVLAIAATAAALPVRADGMPAASPAMSRPAATSVGETLLALGLPALGTAQVRARAPNIVPVETGPNWKCTDSSAPKCCLNKDQRKATCEISVQACHNKGGGVLSSDQSVPSGYDNFCNY